MPEDYTVGTGDCMNSIAFEHGFFWETLWNHSDNADLKSRRRDPSVLLEGDRVHIPDLTLKQQSCASEQKHRFRLKGVPAKLKIRVCIDDEPRANEPYTLFVDGVEAGEGTSDADGYVEMAIPPQAVEGKLLLGTGEDRDVFVFQLGTLDPIETEEGVCGRLHNMGYDVTDLPEAVRAFQRREQMDATGTVDATTRDRLKTRFGQ